MVIHKNSRRNLITKLIMTPCNLTGVWGELYRVCEQRGNLVHKARRSAFSLMLERLSLDVGKTV